MNQGLKTLINLVNERYNFSFTLKKEQMEVISSIMTGRNTFGFLPTGYGKSLTFTMPPLLLDEADPENAPHIALIVSPLCALMVDQVAHNRAKGIKSVAITKMSEMDVDDIGSIKQGDISLVYTSPEALQAGPWLGILRRHSKRICLVALDEVHCLSEWGSDFRPDYLRIVELRSIFSKVPFLGLSATVNTQVLNDIKATLMFEDHQVSVTALLPDRPNIFLSIIHQTSYDMEKDLQWIVDGLLVEKSTYPKTIIFCSSIMLVYDIYEFIKTTLGANAYVSGHTYQSRLVSMYHGEIGNELKEFTLDTFTKQDSVLRVLVSTVAFGMGVDVGDIRQVIHWGKSNTLLCHWQEVGRAGRDGQPAAAIWYPKTTGGEDRAIFEALKRNESLCIRKTFLEHFVLPGMKDLLKTYEDRMSCTESCENCKCELCICCSHCQKKCNCDNVSF